MSNSEAIGKLGHGSFSLGRGRSQTARRWQRGDRVSEGRSFQGKWGKKK